LACTTAKKLYRDHPLMPGVKKALQACRPGSGEVADLMATIRDKQKAALLAGRRTGNEPAPTLSLEGDNFQTVEVNPVAANTVTVLVFFSTWCPHCAAELPRINGFVTAAQALPNLRDRVRVIGVRTAVEKERIPYEQFIAGIKPQFPIYTDATFSLVFGQFVRTQEIRPELPTLAVLDSQGVVRFLIPSGDYRDTGQELMWAVEALL
jgi:thiol-disulfide isomerase/thioredoxin